jgi:hypothetical protein
MRDGRLRERECGEKEGKEEYRTFHVTHPLEFSGAAIWAGAKPRTQPGDSVLSIEAMPGSEN